MTFNCPVVRVTYGLYLPPLPEESISRILLDLGDRQWLVSISVIWLKQMTVKVK